VPFRPFRAGALLFVRCVVLVFEQAFTGEGLLSCSLLTSIIGEFMENQQSNSLPQESSSVFPSPENGTVNSYNQDQDSSRSIPLAALLDERKKFQKQIDEERQLRKQYEDVITALGQNKPNDNNLNDLVKKQYESILQSYGEEAANNWINQLNLKQDLGVMSDNQNLLRQVQEKHKEIFAVPEVKQAIDAYLKLDVDPGRSLAEQGFPEAVEYISSIYKAGYDSALRLKAQNDSAKLRMGSSITSSIPSDNYDRTFTRAEIANMDVETFSKCEKQIFDQMAKGLIK
jgi:hypothetical protein